VAVMCTTDLLKASRKLTSAVGISERSLPVNMSLQWHFYHNTKDGARLNNVRGDAEKGTEEWGGAAP